MILLVFTGYVWSNRTNDHDLSVVTRGEIEPWPRPSSKNAGASFNLTRTIGVEWTFQMRQIVSTLDCVGRYLILVSPRLYINRSFRSKGSLSSLSRQYSLKPSLCISLRGTRTAKIEADRKRKKASISAADRTKKEKHKKKAKMSSSNRPGGEVRASHILIKHQGSRRKASWKDPEGRVIQNTTKESAICQLKALRDDILSRKAKFEDVASRFSDCSSAKRGGDLGQCYFFLSFALELLWGRSAEQTIFFS